ncbi:unnamed protein product [Cuscuta campestris]|uniref:Pentacotripeptide-repeat region of PRORP domain-containing protein n=1 Tax=Cuscuta campestris TaxID=132261 RepID=A0A484M552_9ASTE|nr:unnamed protein product [Cuscuta campestris]
MKELGFVSSPRPFNEIMHLYAKSLQVDKVLEVLAGMKKSGVSPDNDSYRICISSFGLNYDVDGMERMLREMESQPHIVMDWCTYAVVAEFYDREFLVDKAANALEKARVILQKNKNKNKNKNDDDDGGGGDDRSHNLINSDYENVIKSLVKLGEFGEAMRFATEWESLGNWCTVGDISIPCTIIEEYIKNGSESSLRAAYRMIWEWESKGRAGIDRLSLLLCNGLLKAGDLFDAYSCFQGKGAIVYGPLALQRSFFQYLEEECGSFFPSSGGRSLCCCAVSSLRTAGGKTFFELVPINPKYTLTAAVLVHPPTTQAAAAEEEEAVKNMDYYEGVIKSLVESGEFDEARKTAMEWEASSGNLTSSSSSSSLHLHGCLNISKLIIDGYCKKNRSVEAEGMAEAWTRENKPWVRGIWLMLACHYQEEGKLVRGFECMLRFVSLTPWLKRYGGFVLFEMYVYMIEYSRGMNAAGLSEDRMRSQNLFQLNDLLCCTQEEEDDDDQELFGPLHT